MNVFEDSNFLDSVREHIVGISGRCATFDDHGNQEGDEQNFAFSAFVIEIRGIWCLVTAGHVIQRLDDVLNHPRMKLVRCGLADFFNRAAKVKDPTPFPYQTEHRIHVDQGGMDIGLIPLGDFYRASLQANGIAPLPVASWNGPNPPLCEHYVLLGLPEEQTRPIQRTESRGSGLSVLLALVPLQPRPVPAANQVSSIPRFAATLLDGGDLKSPVGMSGGPIIGIRKDAGGTWRYACIAVQGTWDSKTRMVFGTPAGIVVNVISGLLDQQVTPQS